MNTLQDLIQSPVWYILLVSVLLVLGALVYSMSAKLRRLEAVFNQLIPGNEAGNLEENLERLFSRLEQLGYNLNQLGSLQQECRTRLIKAVQKVSVHRFNPFEDMGGDQSFAIALLDEKDNGLLISSLHARDGTRVYSKPITQGKAEISLTEEEKMVLKEALLQ